MKIKKLSKWLNWFTPKSAPQSKVSKENKEIISNIRTAVSDIIQDCTKGGGTTLLIYKQKLEEIFYSTLSKEEKENFRTKENIYKQYKLLKENKKKGKENLEDPALKD